jgi:peptidoglycan/LPS O-acetylase OafA/YrhL
MMVEFLKNLLWTLGAFGLFLAFVIGLALVTVWSSRNRRRASDILFAALILALAVAVAAAFTWSDNAKRDSSCVQAVEATP